ncbi:MAG: phosphodiester glycosidase family protein [Kineosporiaceae bacterium]|nr:phosphodiester glycosidase family protein [Aeromicrobium sp.]
MPSALLLINGTYHDGDYEQPTMVGLLEIEDHLLSPVKTHDLQLSRILTVDPDGRIASIRALTDEMKQDPRPAAARFQSGPAIVENGRLTTGEIAASANGNDAYKRTAIGRTEKGETVIVISKTPRTLVDLGAQVLRVSDYRRRKLTLMNLDGGPSTAIHSAAIPSMSYGADKVTPIVIGVTK